jgi:hypothetical protein
MLNKIRQVQVTEEDVYEWKSHFYNWILQVTHGSVFDPRNTFLTDEDSFHVCIPVLK